MNNQKIRVACAQIQPEFGATVANLKKIEEITRRTDAQLVVFPELATSGYEFLNRQEALALAFDPTHSEPGALLAELARETGQHIVLGFPEQAGDQIFNSSLLIEPDGRLTIYRKLHLFDREKNIFDPGNRAPEVVDTEIGRLGMMICFDWIFPETARMLAKSGAQIICHPSNLVLSFCQRAMFARSVENCVFTVTCNRIGSETRTDRTLTFTGQSQILSQRGEILVQATVETEDLIEAEIEPALADYKNITELNHLFEDRRPDIYNNILN